MILPRGLQDPGYQIMRNQNAGNTNFLKAMTEALFSKDGSWGR